MKNKIKSSLLLAILAGSFFALGFSADHILAVLPDREAHNRVLQRLCTNRGLDDAALYFQGRADEDAQLQALSEL